MTVYLVAVTFLAAFLAGFFVANLPFAKKKECKKRAVIKSDVQKAFENFLNYNGEIQ